MSRAFPWGRPMMPLWANKTQRFQVTKARRKTGRADLIDKAKALDAVAKTVWDAPTGAPELRKAPK